MINAEFYKEKLLELTEKGIRCGLNLKGELVDCCDIDCANCQWNEAGKNCKYVKIKWLLAEHKDYPKLSNFQYQLLQKMYKTYNFIARDEEGDLSFYQKKPAKNMLCSAWCDEVGCEYISSELDDFDFIKWEDSEPWNIQELLKNCEVK